jgi:hypothetical protein
MQLCPAHQSAGAESLSSARETQRKSVRSVMAHLTRPRPQLSLFVAAYLLYDGVRWASASVCR